MLGNIAFQEIDKNKAIIEKLVKKIWENPEGPFREEKACKWCANLLHEHGFDVEVGVGGVPTAIKATWGSNHPIIGFLGEYDALPGQSQKIKNIKEPIVNGGYGHACGHNLIAGANLAAVIALKEEMISKGLKGTLVFYGCPAEEVLTGKGFMARGGAFDDIDLSIAWHPMAKNAADHLQMTGINTVKFHFFGKSAHASEAFKGRSALDAVELMNVGANYLREHVPNDVRFHYTTTSCGTPPNVVPEMASSYYFIRALNRNVIVETYERLCDVAKGAALMTGTKLEIEYLGGCYPLLNNNVLREVVEQSLCEISQEEWTEEEIAFASSFDDDIIKKAKLKGEELINSGVTLGRTIVDYSSSDVGDVQHIAPGVFFTTTCRGINAVGHSWMNTAYVGSSIGMKGMWYASRVIALSALKFLTDDNILTKAKEEFKVSMNGEKYVCPIKKEVLVP